MRASLGSCFTGVMGAVRDMANYNHHNSSVHEQAKLLEVSHEDRLWSQELEQSVHPSQRAAYQERVKQDLTSLFHLLDRNGMSEIIWNHSSAKVPFEGGRIYINPMIRFDAIQSEDLLKVDTDGSVHSGSGNPNITGHVIHLAVHNARPDINFAVHTHDPAIKAVSTLKEGLVILDQAGALFDQRVGYHDWVGLSDCWEEQKSIAEDLGQNRVLMMRNHGALTVGRTASEAFMLMYYLKKACQLQLDVMSTGRPIHFPDPEVVQTTAKVYEDHENMGKHEWPALLDLLKKDRFPLV